MTNTDYLMSEHILSLPVPAIKFFFYIGAFLCFLFIHPFLAALGLRCGAWAPVIVARRLSSCGSRAVERGLSSCGARAQLLRDTWDPPDQGPNPRPPHWQADSQPLCHQGSPCHQILIESDCIQRIVWHWGGHRYKEDPVLVYSFINWWRNRNI